MAVNAKQVVFDFTNPEALGITAPEDGKGTPINDSVIVIDGVTMTNTKVAKTDTRVWNSKGVYDLRIYTTSTFTFAAEENINAVAFDGAAIGFNEFNGNTWVGDAKSVTVTANLTCKINTITVYIGETPDVWVADTINVAQARDLIAAEDKHDHFVKGIVAGQPFNTFSDFKDGRVSFYLVDELGGDSLQAYQVYDKKNAKWASLEAAWEELRIGDTVLVYAGALKLYAAKKIYEIDPGYYDSKLGANPNPPEIVYPIVDTVNVAQAVAIGKALEGGKSTSVEYVVKGFACTTYEPNEGYNDQTWYMADEPDAYSEFQAFQCTPDSHVASGDFMLVRGKIMNYVKDGKSTIEISKGTAVHGEAPKIDTIEVTVAEAVEAGKALDDNTVSEGYYLVTGYVINPNEMEDEDATSQDFFLADEKDAETGPLKAYHAKIEYPGVVAGDKVALFGKIKKSVYEEKTTIQMEYAKVTVIEKAQGIENIVLTEKAQKVVVDGVIYIVRDNKMFNLQGVQVR